MSEAHVSLIKLRDNCCVLFQSYAISGLQQDKDGCCTQAKPRHQEEEHLQDDERSREYMECHCMG